MKRARSAAYWIAPSLFCLLLYWYGLKAWFEADDFAWLSLNLNLHNWHDLLTALFAPRAQGTIRPWSERAFFMAFYALFGLDALPFRIWVFLGQFANLVLLSSITRRLTGSKAAGFWAPVFWVANGSQAEVMTWSSLYNEILCAFFLLLAFHFLLRYIETGRRAYSLGQWAAFLLGFGALELSAVYPALASAYTWLCARKYFRRTLPLFLPSMAFAVIHRMVAPLPAAGVYAMHLDGSIFGTLLTYWEWSLGATWLETPLLLPAQVLLVWVAILSAALLGFVAWKAARRQWLPLFFCFWFLTLIAPLVPLRDHLSGYYPFLPTIGLAMLGGLALVAGWQGRVRWKVVATLAAAGYFVCSVPEAWAASQRRFERSRKVESMVLGVGRAHELHPDKIILLDGVDDDLFWSGVVKHPFRLVGVRYVYLTPGTERNVHAHPELGDVADFVLSADATARALNLDQVVVYTVAGERLKNITSSYAGRPEFQSQLPAPRRIDAGNPLLSYLLGPTWYEADENHRWMPKRATLRIGGPRLPAERLYVTGVCPEAQTVNGPLTMTITAGGTALPPAQILPGNSAFEFVFPLPPKLVGRDMIELSLEVSRTIRPPADGRDLGLAFGVFEIR